MTVVTLTTKAVVAVHPQKKKRALEHWNNAYLNSPDEKLGWYESFPEETICLVEKCNLSPDSLILNVSAGTTTLIEFLLLMGYKNIIVTDTSDASLEKLKQRPGYEKDKIKWIVDDLTLPTVLNQIEPVDLWIDRAVLHFFTRPQETDFYFELVGNKIKKGGFAIFAEYHLNGATKCTGLPVHGYSTEMLAGSLGMILSFLVVSIIYFLCPFPEKVILQGIFLFKILQN